MVPMTTTPTPCHGSSPHPQRGNSGRIPCLPQSPCNASGCRNSQQPPAGFYDEDGGDDA